MAGLRRLLTQIVFRPASGSWIRKLRNVSSVRKPCAWVDLLNVFELKLLFAIAALTYKNSAIFSP
jgi:hypothetical protein